MGSASAMTAAVLLGCSCSYRRLVAPRVLIVCVPKKRDQKILVEVDHHLFETFAVREAAGKRRIS